MLNLCLTHRRGSQPGQGDSTSSMSSGKGHVALSACSPPVTRLAACPTSGLWGWLMV